MPEDPLRLPTQLTLRGPPEELFPADLDDAGLPVEVDRGDGEPGEAYRDELRVGDWAD